MKKKGMAWSTLGKILLVLVSLLILLTVLGMLMGKSFSILDKIKGFFGG